MAPADVVRVANVTDAQVSPNGQLVVYTVSSVADDKTVSTLWLARVLPEVTPIQPTAQPTPRSPTQRTVPYFEWPEIRSAPRLLLPSGWSASTPRWSPDGNSIAFLSGQEEQDGLWVIRLDRPEPRFIAPIQSTNFFIAYAGEPFSWSPDSKRIAYISARPEQRETPDRNRRSDDPRVIDRIQYKSRTSFSDNRRTHVWVVELERPAPQQLTSGAFYDHAVSFSPRGDEIAFLSNHEPNPDAFNNSDIFAVDLGGQVRQITHTKGCEYDPVWSPDGRLIAYTATQRDITTIDSVAEDAHLFVIGAAGGAGRELTSEHDRRVRDPRWSADGRSIMYLASDQGYTTVFRVPVDGGKVSKFFIYVLHGEIAGGFTEPGSKLFPEAGTPLSTAIPFQITSFSVSNRSQSIGREISFPLVVTLGNVVRPAEVWAGFGNSVPLRRLSAHNDTLTRSMRLAVPEEIKFPSFDGSEIQGWLMKPPACTSDRKCPLILSVHGGPHGMYGWSFNPSFQVYVARGYGVLYLNPRGSTGYGQRFSDGTLGEWGGGDYRDLMAGVDEALRKNSWIDGNRLGVTGGSYGGFMTNWIVTQTPRFKAAIPMAGISNLVSFNYMAYYHDYLAVEFGAFPHQKDIIETLWDRSPIRFARNVKTPTLFIHGENDNDVPIAESEQFYIALKDVGVEAVMVRYPREGHGLAEPAHIVDLMDRSAAWYEKHFAKAGSR
jgi:dipeptidyl aminopeptidase/acylaminoacyl peptidase